MANNPTFVLTGKVRFSYCNVFEAVASNEGEEPKYSVCIIIPKSDKTTVDKINAAVEAAKTLGKSKLANSAGKIPANIKTPLRDGDLDRSDDPAFAGCYFLNASTRRKPGLVDRNLNEIIDPREFYSGCYGRATLNFFAFDAKGNKGVAAGLNNLQKLEDGEPLGGGASASVDFGGENEYNDDDVL